MGFDSTMCGCLGLRENSKPELLAPRCGSPGTAGGEHARPRTSVEADLSASSGLRRPDQPRRDGRFPCVTTSRPSRIASRPPFCRPLASHNLQEGQLRVAAPPALQLDRPECQNSRTLRPGRTGLWKCLRGVLSLLGPTTSFQTLDFTPRLWNNLLTAMISLVLGVQSNLMQSHPIDSWRHAKSGLWKAGVSLGAFQTGQGGGPSHHQPERIPTEGYFLSSVPILQRAFSRSLRPRGLFTLDLEIPERPLSNLILRYGRIPGPLLLSDLRPADPSGLSASSRFGLQTSSRYLERY